MIRAFAGLSLALVIGAPAAQAVESKVSSVLPEGLANASLEQRIGDSIPLDLEFVDHEGQSVRIGDYFGDKPVILAPVYYHCPMLCGLALEGLASSLKALTLTAATDYELVAFSFDPADTPERAAERRELALERYGGDVGDGWHFLTGPESSIDRLTDAIGFEADFDEASGEFIHAATVLVLTPDGTIARYYYGIEYAPKDLRFGLVEASDGNVGTPIDQVLLYCFRYDPAAGKYSLLTMRLLRITAAVTIAGLAAMIIVFLRLERTRPKPSEGMA